MTKRARRVRKGDGEMTEVLGRGREVRQSRRIPTAKSARGFVWWRDVIIAVRLGAEVGRSRIRCRQAGGDVAKCRAELLLRGIPGVPAHRDYEPRRTTTSHTSTCTGKQHASITTRPRVTTNRCHLHGAHASMVQKIPAVPLTPESAAALERLSFTVYESKMLSRLLQMSSSFLRVFGINLSYGWLRRYDKRSPSMLLKF